jgi:3-hydroxyisobutyrate dehydrogenase-like beta-hydroxyacid dehydrogenase
MMRIALIGLGEVGQILADDLRKAGEISAYDILFADEASKPSRAAAARNIGRAKNAGEAVTGASLIVSAVTAASDMEAAKSVIPGLGKGAFFVDLNSVSPGQKEASAEVINGAGGRYVEAAVMTPFPPKRIASPMLLGGPHAAAFLDQFGGLGFSARVFSEKYGRASATKMCRSVMIKGIEALITESMLAARHYGVEQTVLESLSDLLPVGDWEKLARYMISRSLEHGTRRAEEMREVAETVREAGIDPLMSLAAAARQDWAAMRKEALSESEFGRLLDKISSLAADNSSKRTA